MLDLLPNVFLLTLCRHLDFGERVNLALASAKCSSVLMSNEALWKFEGGSVINPQWIPRNTTPDTHYQVIERTCSLRSIP